MLRFWQRQIGLLDCIKEARTCYALSDRSRITLHDADNAIMDDEEIALIVRCWRDLQTNLSQLRVVQVASGEEVHLSDGSFLLRISLNEDGTVIRCFVRHLTSGREAYLQGGTNLRTFVNACLLNDGETTSSPEEMLPPPENLSEAASKPGGDIAAFAAEASPPETLAEDTNE